MTTTNEITLQHIEDFFSIGKEPKVYYDSATVTQGTGVLNPQATNIPSPKIRRREKTDYASEYQKSEMESLLEKTDKSKDEAVIPNKRSINSICDVDDVTTVGGAVASMQDVQETDPRVLYATYYTNTPPVRKDLPISRHKNEIVRMINTYEVLVIQGSTGCGKTTQVPQYILDRHATLGVHCNIVVTQPRRIAAISIARRVCQERGWQLPGIVGYQVGMDNNTSSDTRLTYMTTGVLIQKLIAQRHMNMYTHIIIDEVHERDQETDLLLLIVKKFSRTNSKSTKIVLMSATIDVQKFRDYFAIPVRGKLSPAHVFDIAEKNFMVTEYYLDSLASLGPLPILDPHLPELPEESYYIAHQLIKHFDRMEITEQETSHNGFAENRGSVLIFLPGYEEIGKMQDMLREDALKLKWWVIPLHSTCTTQEQDRVFCKPEDPQGRKIILSTNIAESSITVPDIKYVIDFCLIKCLMCDEETNYSCLKLCWASKANCIQRRGRAGRVSDGRVYHMVPQRFYDEHLPEEGQPEIKRCPLESTVLRVKRLDLGEPKALLALALDPPDLSDIENAILVLKECNALAITSQGRITPFDGDLMYIGRIMSCLPLDVKVSKLIVLGYVLGCLEECLIIASCITVQSIFSKPFQKSLESYKSRLAWAEGTFSDCLAYLNAFRIWKQVKSYGFFRVGGASGSRSERKEINWGISNFIEIRKIREADNLMNDLIMRLERMHIRVPQNQPPQNPAENVLLLKVAICGAFYPNYFMKVPLDEQEISRAVNKKDPLKTVVISGLPQNQGLLYVNAIRQMFKPCSSKMQIDFEEQKAYIQFQPENIQYRSETTEEEEKKKERGGIIHPVYLAVKMRQLRMPLTLRLYQPNEAKRKLEQLLSLHNARLQNEHGLRTNRISVPMVPTTVKRVPLPTIGKNVISLHVTSIVNCGHFWARYHDDPEVQMQLNFIEQMIRMHPKTPTKKKPTPGQVVLAAFRESENDAEEYYRARVEEITRENKIKVFFLDYGNTDDVKMEKICEINAQSTPELITTPAQAFECFLSEIKPSSLKSSDQTYCKEANKFFRTLFRSPYALGRIYSVVQSHVRLELVLPRSDGQQVSINSLLIDNGYAEKAEESLVSKQDHEARVQFELMSMQAVIPDREYLEAFTELTLDGEMEDISFSAHKVHLRGPVSPLEISFVGMTKRAFGRPVRFDRDGVNSVSLDPEPQERHSRMLVACQVGLSSSGTAVRVRNTTLMPNIRGFPYLMSLIFCPYAEFRTDPSHIRYTGALCGLGYDPDTGESLYKEHDMELVFDVIFDQTDIAQINLARMYMNFFLGSEDTISGWVPLIRKYQTKLRVTLLDLLGKQRKYQEPYEPRKPYCWNLLDPRYLLEATTESTYEDCSHVLPMHKMVILSEDVFMESLRSHVRELHAQASKSDEPDRIRCRLCNTICYSPRELLLHLNSSEHKQKETGVFYG